MTSIQQLGKPRVSLFLQRGDGVSHEVGIDDCSEFRGLSMSRMSRNHEEQGSRDGDGIGRSPCRRGPICEVHSREHHTGPGQVCEVRSVGKVVQQKESQARREKKSHAPGNRAPCPCGYPKTYGGCQQAPGHDDPCKGVHGIYNGMHPEMSGQNPLCQFMELMNSGAGAGRRRSALPWAPTTPPQ